MSLVCASLQRWEHNENINLPAVCKKYDFNGRMENLKKKCISFYLDWILVIATSWINLPVKYLSAGVKNPVSSGFSSSLSSSSSSSEDSSSEGSSSPHGVWSTSSSSAFAWWRQGHIQPSAKLWTIWMSSLRYSFLWNRTSDENCVMCLVKMQTLV